MEDVWDDISIIAAEVRDIRDAGITVLFPDIEDVAKQKILFLLTNHITEVE